MIRTKKLFFVILIVILLCGCSSKKKTEPNQTKKGEQLEEIKMFIDDKPISFDNTTLTINSYFCEEYTDNQCVSVLFYVKNNSLEQKTYNLSDAVVVKEETNVKYEASFEKTLIINAELTSETRISSIIPSSIDSDNYSLTFVMNKKRIRLFLYERPDELREDRIVSFYIGGQKVGEEKVKNGRAKEGLFVYDSSDTMYYCNKWYIDEDMRTQYDYNQVITENFNLYGETKNTYSLKYYKTDKKTYLSYINHIPANKELIIPRSYDGGYIAISDGALSNICFDKLYLPNTLTNIYGSNFKDLTGEKVIYYEGTEEQWKNLFYNGTPYTQNVVYNATYPTFE